MFGLEVQITNLTKSFGERQVLKDVNFECQAGESVIIENNRYVDERHKRKY